MNNTVIKIENLSKLYRLGEIGTGTLSHDLNRFWAKVRGKEDPFAKVGHVNDRTQKAEKGELIAALCDINLEVKQGEVLGIIGKNGAGKSTLLKLLSRVTSPTTGTIKTKGRMASLLEVGTGFHPEMTGRENIYMNGTIMGMRKWEITKKLEEIVNFAGVAKYLDTPVKRYSSGMKVRLGFAVAAFLEPEILIVDEVLAVGDAEFQKKAIGKMQDVSKGDGRTVLFVSHNMASIRNLCSYVTILQNGRIEGIGDTNTMIDNYLLEFNRFEFANPNILENNQKKDFQLSNISISDKKGNLKQTFDIDAEICIHIECTVRIVVPGLYGYIVIFNDEGVKIIETDTNDFNPNILDGLKIGKHRFTINVPKYTLRNGDYKIYMSFGSSHYSKGFLVDTPGYVSAFQIIDNSTKRGAGRKSLLGTILKWEQQESSKIEKF